MHAFPRFGQVVQSRVVYRTKVGLPKWALQAPLDLHRPSFHRINRYQYAPATFSSSAVTRIDTLGALSLILCLGAQDFMPENS